MKMLDVVLSTDGSSLWSDVAKPVKIVGLSLSYVNTDEDFGELRVYFDTKSWDVDTDGLIYTDSGFMSQLKELLKRIGLAGNYVSYSEQGMQGDNYVSCDVEEEFIRSYNHCTVFSGV